MKRSALLILAALWALLSLVAPPQARAVGFYLTGFNSRYPNSSLGGTLGCTLCHPGGNTGSFNAYGSAFRSKSGSTSSRFAQIESLDSDRDGYSNLAEIKAGTNPSNSASHPVPTPTPTPTPKPTPTPTPTPRPTPTPTPTPRPTPTPLPTPTPVPTPLPAPTTELQLLERLADMHYANFQYSTVAESHATHLELKMFARNFSIRTKVQMEFILDSLLEWYGIAYTPQLPGGYHQTLSGFMALGGPVFDIAFIRQVILFDQLHKTLAQQGLAVAKHPDLQAMLHYMITLDASENVTVRNWYTAWTAPAP